MSPRTTGDREFDPRRSLRLAAADRHPVIRGGPLNRSESTMATQPGINGVDWYRDEQQEKRCVFCNAPYGTGRIHLSSCPRSVHSKRPAAPAGQPPGSPPTVPTGESTLGPEDAPERPADPAVEVEAITTIARALLTLPDHGSVRRVLRYCAERHGEVVILGREPS